MNIKKIIKAILCFLPILLLCAILEECGRSEGTYVPIELWFEEKSPNKSYAIQCDKYVNAPPYSKQMVKIWILREKPRGGVRYGDIKIDNKGKELDKSNYEIEWTATGAILTFKGLGQSPVSYVIEWENAFPDFEKELEYWEGTD